MEKLEKVIAALEQCYYGKCTKCPYEFSGDMSCNDEVCKDALELLKGYDELETAYSKLFDRNKEAEYELEDTRRRASELEKKYTAAVEAAAVATEIAAKARKVDGDLISRSELIGTESLLMTDIVENDPVAKFVLEQVLHDIKAAPAAEAEPVVRCKKCVHYHADTLSCAMMGGSGVNWYGEDYCSYGAHMDREG